MTATTDIISEAIAKIREVDPRTRTPEQHKVIRAYQQVALEVLYMERGVGDSIAQKLKFWESTCPDGYSMSHNPSDKMKVTVFEESWIVNNYPQDAILC